MKTKIVQLFILLFLVSSINAENLKVYLSYGAYNTPENIPYLETYLTIKGSSVKHILLESGKYQGACEVQIIFKQNDSIVNFAKYELAGPTIDDTLGLFPNFLDVQRYALSNGKFDIEFSVKDMNTDSSIVSSLGQYTIDFENKNTNFSDIQILSSYEKSTEVDNLTRNGYRLTPYVFNYFPESETSLNFYAELYNSSINDTNKAFLLSYYIRPFEVEKKLDGYNYVKRKNTENVNIVLGSFNIESLPSGNYLLVMEARDRNNQILSKKEAFFQRNNPGVSYVIAKDYSIDYSKGFNPYISNRDSLASYIKCLKPISTDAERLFAESLVRPDASFEDMRRYFVNFWVERDNVFPLDTWLSYKFAVEKVDHNYKTQNTPGYDTDRGRVFLQYGAPNAIAQSYNEPNAFPYEIWHYHQMANGQNDKKFVFYTQEIATNDFELIHSNAIGELNNYKWRIWINSRDTRYTNQMNVDDAYYREIWGSNQDDYYYMPR